MLRLSSSTCIGDERLGSTSGSLLALARTTFKLEQRWTSVFALDDGQMLTLIPLFNISSPFSTSSSIPASLRFSASFPFFPSSPLSSSFPFFLFSYSSPCLALVKVRLFTLLPCFTLFWFRSVGSPFSASRLVSLLTPDPETQPGTVSSTGTTTSLPFWPHPPEFLHVCP